jgi:hypothetical protein
MLSSTISMKILLKEDLNWRECSDDQKSCPNGSSREHQSFFLSERVVLLSVQDFQRAPKKLHVQTACEHVQTGPSESSQDFSYLWCPDRSYREFPYFVLSRECSIMSGQMGHLGSRNPSFAWTPYSPVRMPPPFIPISFRVRFSTKLYLKELLGANLLRILL